MKVSLVFIFGLKSRLNKNEMVVTKATSNHILYSDNLQQQKLSLFRIVRLILETLEVANPTTLLQKIILILTIKLKIIYFYRPEI